MSEAKITKKVKALLDSYDAAGEPVYYNKISDRFSSGIPDFQGTFHGISFYIELKDEGEEPRKLQQWHLDKAKNAGAVVLSTDDYVTAERFLEWIRLNHKNIALMRYD